MNDRRLAVWVCVAVLLFAPSAARPEEPDDPYYHSQGSWEQDGDDQWGLKRVGFTPPGTGDSAWDLEDGSSNPVIVAVIDTGIDYHHPDLAPETIWRNPKEQLNGSDDDGNGYVDDLIGWNFIDGDNNPWDHAGHGTHVAGVIAAATGNGEGIAGVNRGVRIMPLKVLNFVGRGRTVSIAAAIFYAVDHGARIINLSLGGHEPSKTEKLAIDYASKKGVLVVVAAGNAGTDTADFGLAGLSNVITVSATGPDDKKAGFSNWGLEVDIAAPGVGILSLRARRTDLNLVARIKDYTAGSGFVGPQARYYRTDGTSFAAPFVTGVASLLLAKNPALDAEQLRRMLLYSARDIEPPGVDRSTGHGLLDARAALVADPEFFIDAAISGIEVVQEGKRTVVRLRGTADADMLRRAWLEIGEGKEPTDWKKVSGNIERAVNDDTLADIEATHFQGAKQWSVRLFVEHKNGERREARFEMNVGG